MLLLVVVLVVVGRAKAQGRGPHEEVPPSSCKAVSSSFGWVLLSSGPRPPGPAPPPPACVIRVERGAGHAGGMRQVVEIMNGFAANPNADPTFWKPAPLLASLAAAGKRFNG